METESTNRTTGESAGLNGGLALFLILGISVRVLLGCFAVYRLYVNPIDLGLWFKFITTVQMAVSLTITVMTILAFVRRWDNALPLAYTCLAFVAMDGLYDIALDRMGIAPYLWAGVGVLVWALLWFCYLKTSTQAEMRFGDIAQRWHRLELISLAIYALVDVAALSFMKEASQNMLVFMQPRTVIEKTVEMVNRSLPKVVLDGIILKQVSLDNDTVVLDYKFVCMSADSLQQYLEKENLICFKQEMLSAFARQDANDASFLTTCTANGLHIRNQYIEQYGKMINVIRITPEEYIQARTLGDSFRCDSLSWQTALQTVRQTLPQPILESCLLEEVNVDFKTQRLEFVVKLPTKSELLHMDKEEILAYLRRKSRLWSDNLCIKLASSDKMMLHVKFLRADGTEYATVVVNT